METISLLGVNTPVAIAAAIIGGYFWKASNFSNRWLIPCVFVVAVLVNGFCHLAFNGLFDLTFMKISGKLVYEGSIQTAAAIAIHQTRKTLFLKKVTDSMYRAHKRIK